MLAWTLNDERRLVRRRLIMTILKSALAAAALVATIAAANAFGVEDLQTGYHGNTPTARSYSVTSHYVSPSARGAFARSHR